MTGCHSLGEDTGLSSTTVRYLIADDGTFGSIHDESDVSLDTDSYGLAVIRCLLIGNEDIVQIRR